MLRLILETEEGFELVGEASDGADAVCLAGNLQPDVVLMDLRMLGMVGIKAIEFILTARPTVPVVILTTFNGDDHTMRGLRTGALGFLLKHMGCEAIFAATRAAPAGRHSSVPWRWRLSSTGRRRVVRGPRETRLRRSPSECGTR